MISSDRSNGPESEIQELLIDLSAASADFTRLPQNYFEGSNHSPAILGSASSTPQQSPSTTPEVTEGEGIQTQVAAFLSRDGNLHENDQSTKFSSNTSIHPIPNAFERIKSYTSMITPSHISRTGSASKSATDNIKSNDSSISYPRQLYFNYPPGNDVSTVCSNKVITSQYTILSFLPKFLYQNFQKLANVFFLVVCILQSIKSISNTYGYPTNAPVLITVLCIDAIFVIVEDLRRHNADKEANARVCHRITMGQMEDSIWADIHVGDFVQVRNREVVPADILILAVSEPAGEAAGGICYVETKSLDGETNLKLRQAVAATMNTVVNPSELMLLQGTVKYEAPNAFVDKFNGKLEISLSRECGAEVSPLSMKNILLRGCTLRNTDWVYGFVLSTGKNCKIMQSSSRASIKTSRVMQIINKMIAWLCMFLVCACVLAAFVNVWWQEAKGQSLWYLPAINPTSNVRFERFFEMLFKYFLLLYQLIPISLYVSLTSVKFLQAQFIVWDLEMYHTESDTPALVRTMELNEDLGQIAHIFSDKTGTLTQNIMEFRKCCINGTSYGTGTTEIGRAARMRSGKDAVDIEVESFESLPLAPSRPYVNFVDSYMTKLLEAHDGTLSFQRDRVIEFFTHLAICHTVIPEKLEDGEIRLSASSPDEQALVAGAASVGFEFRTRSVGKAVAKILGKIQFFEILEVLEFTSTRKRMSVILRKSDGNLFLYTKGADMMIFPRLRTNVDCETQRLREETRKCMEVYAEEGLRTLTIASKPLEEREYKSWKRNFDEAMSNLGELELRREGQPNAIDRLMEEIECGLDLLGATAIEDKLQEGVPEALTQLMAAGIRIWMLTGDKEETAINIGHACSLLHTQMEQIVINCKAFPTEEAIHEELLRFLDTAQYAKDKDFALVIDGEALEIALCPTLAKLLIECSHYCRSVICNRVSPAQKAQMVNLVRQHLPDIRTLAIGDGANDVAMIQAAHVGVGISGQEGLQAVNSSDYAIAQFRYLQRLVLIHGRWNYRRISKLVLYMFYKNITLVLAQYMYGFLSGASGAKLYWEVGVQVYNILFTGIPILVVGVLDQDLPAWYSAQHPEFYRRGLEDQDFNFRRFLGWVGSAVYESAVIFIVCMLGYRTSETDESRVELGICAFTLTVLIVNLKICFVAEKWTLISTTFWLASVLAWFCVAPLGTHLADFALVNVNFDEFGSFFPTANSSAYSVLLVLGVFIALSRQFCWNQYRKLYRPCMIQMLQQQIQSTNRCLSVDDLEAVTLCISPNSETGNWRRTDQESFDEDREEEPIDKFHHIAGEKSVNSHLIPPQSIRFGRLNSRSKLVDLPELDQVSTMKPAQRPTVGSVKSMASDQTLGNDTASVYSTSVHGNMSMFQRKIDSPSRPSFHRSTGFAFSCDEETTLAESYIASNSIDKADAVPAAFRNSVSRRENNSFLL